MVDKIEDLFHSISNENYFALSKGLTLVESSKHEDRILAEELLEHVWKNQSLKSTGSTKIGITGSPGAGKSSFINAIVPSLLNRYEKIAILPIDPSSAESGGSILGDQTRMDDITTNERVYIRPSPNRLHLGGTARTTYESILLCEAAKFDLIIVETVGVGQSEIAIQNMVDFIIYLFTPLGGDILQGIKKGVMEIAQFIVINKFDDPTNKEYLKIFQQFKEAVHLHEKRHESQTVLPFSIYHKKTQQNFLESLFDYLSTASFRTVDKRITKHKNLFNYFLKLEIENTYNQTIKNSSLYNQYLSEVSSNRISPFKAAKKTFQQIIQK